MKYVRRCLWRWVPSNRLHFLMHVWRRPRSWSWAWRAGGTRVLPGCNVTEADRAWLSEVVRDS